MLETPFPVPPLVEPPLVESADRTSAKRRRRTWYTPLPGIIENAVYLAPSAWPLARRALCMDGVRVGNWTGAWHPPALSWVPLFFVLQRDGLFATSKRNCAKSAQCIGNEQREKPTSLLTKTSSPSAPNIFAARKCCSCQILYSIYSFTATAERETAPNVPKNLRYIGLDFFTELKSTVREKTCDLPDENIIFVVADRFRCVEVLFQLVSR